MKMIGFHTFTKTCEAHAPHRTHTYISFIIYYLSFIICLFLFILSLVSCEKELKPATVAIKDPVRHYYPVLQGETLEVSYEIENTSDNPLFIREIQTTCGCIIPRTDLPIIILPKKSGFVEVGFNTIKNTGYVCHYIYCYGNFKDSTCIELQFDTNVVPRADYIRDYEQLWHEQTTVRRSTYGYEPGTPQ